MLFRGRGGAFMRVCLSGENGQDTNLSKFALIYLEKGQLFKTLFVKVQKHYIFPYAGKNGKKIICTFRVVGPNLPKMCVCVCLCFFFFRVGLVFLFFLFCGPPWLFFCYFLFLCLFFEKKTNLVFPLKVALLAYFSVSPFLSP